jgi:choline dehydrogenase-like flavoprotein
MDFYEHDPRRGFYGGGGLDARFQQYPIIYALGGLPPRSPTWGAEFKKLLRQYYTRTMCVATHSTSLPVETNGVSIDPELKDAWGVPAMRVTYRDHADDIRMGKFLVDRAMEILDEAGARKRWRIEPGPQTASVHLLGTCRMGNDPRASVVDRFHRAHDVRNLFICDGSSLVTSTRGQPTETICALAFRAGEHIAAAARRGEI